jgi:CheY-like chemotaxis protein
MPAIVLTAYGRAEDRMRTLAAGFSMHMPKPVDPVELTTIIASVVERLRVPGFFRPRPRGPSPAENSWHPK